MESAARGWIQLCLWSHTQNVVGSWDAMMYSVQWSECFRGVGPSGALSPSIGVLEKFLSQSCIHSLFWELLEEESQQCLHYVYESTAGVWDPSQSVFSPFVRILWEIEEQQCLQSLFQNDAETRDTMIFSLINQCAEGCWDPRVAYFSL